MKSKSVSVNVTANGLAASIAQKTANQAAEKIKNESSARTTYQIANDETLSELNQAQSDFESNLAWTKEQIEINSHQNDSAVNSLKSDMETAWNSMTSTENSLYNSASTATSEVDSHLESLRAQSSQSLADLHDTANSLHAAANSLHADADSIRGSLMAATSELGKDITSTRNSLDGVRNSLRAATSEVGNNLNSAKTSLTATGNSLANRAGSLATATSELQRQTGQISGSLSTADSMIMFNSNAIAEVKRTAGEISSTVSNIRVGGRNLLTNTRTLSDVWNGATETVDGFTAVKATQTNDGNYDPIAWFGLTNIKSNTDYVLTFYAKASKQTTIYSFLYNIGTDTVYGDGSTPNTLTTDYQRYTVHFHTMAMPAGRVVSCLPVRLMENGVTAWIYGCQLEEGNTATQWQPNPTDTDQAISQISQTADTIRADLTNTKGDVASVKATASSLQSQITDNKNNISSVKQTASGLTSRVGNAEGSISQLQQTANGLTSTVSNMKVGGRNLLGGDTKSEHTASYPASGYVDMNSITMLIPANQTQYTLSFDAKSTHTGDSITCYLYNLISGGHNSVTGGENNQGVKNHNDDGNMPFTLTDSYQRYWVKWTNTQNDGKLNVICGRLFAGMGSGSVSVKNIKLEVGNTPTDWTPAPETFDESISQLQQTADRIQALVNDNKGNISSVTQTANAVKTDLVNTKGDVSSLQQTANKLTSDMADAKGNISSLQQTATGLQSTVQSQSGQISQLQQDAKGLTATVADGGQNLILNSGNPSTLDHWGWTGEVTLHTHPFWKNGTENLFILSNTSTTDEKKFWSERFAIEPNQDYTLSFYAFNNSALINADVWYLPRKSGSSKEQDTAINLAPSVKFSTGNAQYVKLTFNSGDYNEGYIRFDNNGSTTEGTWASLYLTDIQLEKGQIATAWSNSPGDIAQLKLTADGLTSKVADTQGNVSSLQQTASMMQKQITDNKKNISSVKQTADTVRIDLTNANHDIASVKAKADSLTSSMANANDQISTLQQDAKGLTATVADGGQNLILNSGNPSTLDHWGWTGEVTLHTHPFWKNGTENLFILSNASTTDEKMFWSERFAIEPNQDYTLSFYAFNNSALINADVWYLPRKSGSSKEQDTAINLAPSVKFSTGNAQYVKLTFNSGDYNEGYIRFDNNGSTTEGTWASLYLTDIQLEKGQIATAWSNSPGDIASLQLTASQLTSDMKDAKGNISSLQQTAGSFGTRLTNAEGDVTSLNATATSLQTQITDNKNHAATIESKADGISARVSGIENNKVVGSLLKLTDTEAGLGSFVNGKLVAGINTNADGGVTIDGKLIHISGYTEIDNGAINAEKITVHNQMDNGEDQNLAIAWGKLSSIIGGKDDKGDTLWGAVNQTKDKFSSYYTKSENDNLQRSLISQTADKIALAVDDAKNFTTFTVSASNTWDFNYTKSPYGNWFLNGETTNAHVYNGPNITPWMYVTSRGPKDGSRVTVTAWKDNDPTQYQRVWNGNSWTEWVMLPNTQNMITAINMSPDGVKINGKNIELNGNTTVTGRLDLMQNQANWVDQDTTKYHNPWRWTNAHIYFDNYLQLLGEDCFVEYTNTNTLLNGNNRFYSITTLTPGYLKFTTYQNKVSTTDENFSGQISRSYLDSGRLETPEVYTDKFAITGHHIRVRDNKYLMVSNKNGTNFDNYGNVGFQVYGGIVLGKQTIGSPTKDIYFQQGNIDSILGQNYSAAPKVTLHADHVASQSANTVTSRLSTKTAITKVSYDRALMAVQNTDMYDYKYISDESGQHYVSGIIDDIHDKPEYNMDPMLINKERTARIDANLLGYHHVILQEILKRLDKLEAK